MLSPLRIPEVERGDCPLAALEGRAPPAPEWFTEALGQEPERSHVVVGGAALEVLTWGHLGAPGLLLVHGARAHADWWSHIAPALAKTRRVAAFSWSGMGRSEWRERYDLDIYSEEAVSVADHAGLFVSNRKPTVVAHSFGGYPILRGATRWGDRFEKALLLDAFLDGFHNPPKLTSASIYPTLTAALARFSLSPPQPCEIYVADWLARQAVKPVMDQNGATGWTWRFDPDLLTRLGRIDVGSDFRRVQCPLVFVRGACSKLITPEVEQRQRSVAPPNSVFITMDGSGHHMMADQPQALIRMLDDLC